eukprot:775321-Alexandrium_andersonii.AAC.1
MSDGLRGAARCRVANTTVFRAPCFNTDSLPALGAHGGSTEKPAWKRARVENERETVHSGCSEQ